MGSRVAQNKNKNRMLRRKNNELGKKNINEEKKAQRK
jgi:hypothetical protein